MSKTATAYWLSLAAAASVSTTAMADQSTRTKSWFMENPQARSAVVRICRDDPGTARHVANCINAEEAAAAVAIRDHGPRAPSSAELCAMMPPAFKAVNNCATTSPISSIR